MNAERYVCCEHCAKHPTDNCPNNHLVPCAVMDCGRIDATRKRVEA